jgi:hypothetical protein
LDVEDLNGDVVAGALTKVIPDLDAEGVFAVVEK